MKWLPWILLSGVVLYFVGRRRPTMPTYGPVPRRSGWGVISNMELMEMALRLPRPTVDMSNTTDYADELAEQAIEDALAAQ